MKIVNGRWVDDDNNPIDNFNVTELLEIGQKVKAVYGEDITYDRIDVISSINKLTNKEESGLVYILEKEGVISKLSGY
jgi:hypothetical protein